MLLLTLACLTSGALPRPLAAVPRAAVACQQLARARRLRSPGARMLSAALEGPSDGGANGGLGEAPAPSAAKTGRLRSAPDMLSLGRILRLANKAMLIDAKEASKALKSKSLNAKQRASRLAARKLDVLTKHLVVPLRDYQRDLRAFLRELHPFERELVRLTLAARERAGGLPFAEAMAAVDELRKALTAEGKAAAAACASLRSAAEADAFEAESLAALLSRAEGGQEAVQGLADIAKLIRTLPSVSTDEPLAVLVGLPNVGKSSLVGALSSATPEVNAYPFTTKRLTLGHLRSRGALRLQIMDTPGVLARADVLRNAIEQLTFCALRELRPTVILFVLDPTGLGGRLSAVREQLAVRTELRALHPAALWVDVLSKADILAAAAAGGDVGACGGLGEPEPEPVWVDLGWADEAGGAEAERGAEAGPAAEAAEEAGDVVADDSGAPNAEAQAVLESAQALEAALALEAGPAAAPAYRVSVPTGEGIAELRALLDGLIHALDDGAPLGAFGRAGAEGGLAHAALAASEGERLSPSPSSSDPQPQARS